MITSELISTTRPTIRTMTTASTTNTTTSVSYQTIFWSFDGNTNDMCNNYNGTAINGPNYTTGYTGLDSKALSVTRPLSQYVNVASPYFNYTYLGQSKSSCGDDAIGTTIITVNKWCHAAFVYDYSTSTQSLYLNGVLENNRTATLYQGRNGSITIGTVEMPPSSNTFFGYIDQVSLVSRTKSANEVLFDATVVCYYSFDSDSYYDYGPLGLNGSANGLSPAIGIGRINDGIAFISTNSYFLSGGMTLLGTTNQPYSSSVWIKPTSVNGGTILYVSNCNNNCVSNWCMPFIGFTSTGQIAIQSWSSASNGTIVILTRSNLMTNIWTHIVQTYSPSNGMHLYLNGLLYSQSSVFTYMASDSSDYIYLGSFPLTACAATSSVISSEQLYGLIDEFYLLSREITATEVSNLANP